jgi:hypothetical protein
MLRGETGYLVLLLLDLLLFTPTSDLAGLVWHWTRSLVVAAKDNVTWRGSILVSVLRPSGVLRQVEEAPGAVTDAKKTANDCGGRSLAQTAPSTSASQPIACSAPPRRSAILRQECRRRAGISKAPAGNRLAPSWLSETSKSGN